MSCRRGERETERAQGGGGGTVEIMDNYMYNNLLPATQRVQKDWAKNCEKKEITGILLWDLSAAFDCLDCEILCNKLSIYGFSANTQKCPKRD